LACPYFMPLEKLDGGSWPHPGRLPLGCGWSGHCTAPGHEGQVPTSDVLESFCNLGYASSCGWVPIARAWDAVRLAIVAPAEVKKGFSDKSAGHTIRISYVCEKSHRPAEHGDLEFDLQASVWLRSHDDARVQKMAECFLESYLRKKS
jgi:hypothetical protein